MPFPRCTLPVTCACLALSTASVLAGCATTCPHDSPQCPSYLAGAGFRSPLSPDVDADGDGLLDAEEAALSERFAPVVTLYADDSTRPASMEWLARRLPLDLSCGKHADVATALNATNDDVRRGSDSPADWVTYVHVYPSKESGSVLVQYWFFYPHNDGMLWFDHESDWEHVTVSLDAARQPIGVFAARHGNNAPGRWRPWDQLRKVDGTHPEILSAKGSHASYFDLADVGWQDIAGRCETLEGACRHPQWRTWQAGGLRHLGERRAPMDARAMTHRGLWGAAGVLPGTSAPSGPAYQSGWCARGGPACDHGTVL